jgi:hypothetical protein
MVTFRTLIPTRSPKQLGLWFYYICHLLSKNITFKYHLVAGTVKPHSENFKAPVYGISRFYFRGRSNLKANIENS